MDRSKAGTSRGGCAWRRLFGWLACLWLAVAALPVQAQEPIKGQVPVIVVVDAQKILRDSQAAKSARDAIAEQRQRYEQELERERTALEQAEEELKRQRSVLSPEAFQERRRELEKRLTEFRRDTEERQAVLSNAFNKTMRGLTLELNKTLANIMKDEGITVALPRTAVLVFDQNLDITEAVLAAFNERVPSVKIDFSEQEPVSGG